MKILIAEDEAMLAKVIGNSLRQLGYEVKVCLDGEEALNFIDISTWDLLILDVKLPKVSGIQIVAHVLQNKKNNLPKMIICSAFDTFRVDFERLGASVSDYLVKPIKLKELTEKVKNLLG